MLQAVIYLPISVGIASADLVIYKSGIVSQCRSTSIDQYMLVVGYGTDPASQTDFWILKTYWGSSFGESGYVRIKRLSGVTPGICNMSQIAMYPWINYVN